MGLILTLREPLTTLLDLEPLSALACAGAETVLDTKLQYGRFAVSAWDLFQLEPGCENGLILRGELRLAIHIGAGMRGGRIAVESSVGAGAGARMQDGELVIRGDAGMDACRDMQGGFVHIGGKAESGLMRDSRRGLVVLEGLAQGEICGGMRGGTALLLGDMKEDGNLARGLSRGTVILPKGAKVPAGFSRTADADLAFLRLLFCTLEKRGVCVPDGWVGGVFTRYCGDAAGLGKGELFVPAEARA